MYQLLTNNSISFLYNKSTYFSGRLKYDFIVQEKDLIIEMHGLQHYKDTGFHKMNGKDANQEFKNDTLKREIALNNGYNNYKNVSCETVKFKLDYENSTLVSKTETMYTTVAGYVKRDYDNVVYSSPSSNYCILLPNLPNNESGWKDINVISGSISIPIEEYNKYQSFYLVAYGARARWTCNTAYNTYTGLATTVSGTPSGDNYEVKDYIKTVVGEDGQETVSIVNDVSLLSDSDYSSFAVASFTTRFDNDSNPTFVIFDYELLFFANADTQSHTDYKINTEWNGDYTIKTNSRYLGAFDIRVFGTGTFQEEASYRYDYSIGKGNTYTVLKNEFIQANCKYIPSDEDFNGSMYIHDYLGNAILNEFGNGKKTAKVEWVGSPYIRLYDIVTLDNGVSYRIHYIENIFDGGFKQILHLVEKE